MFQMMNSSVMKIRCNLGKFQMPFTAEAWVDQLADEIEINVLEMGVLRKGKNAQ